MTASWWVSAAMRLGREDVGGAPVVEWREILNRPDMHLYATYLWNGRDMNPLQRELCVVQTRELAGFSPELAEGWPPPGRRPRFSQPLQMQRA